MSSPLGTLLSKLQFWASRNAEHQRTFHVTMNEKARWGGLPYWPCALIRCSKGLYDETELLNVTLSLLRQNHITSFKWPDTAVRLRTRKRGEPLSISANTQPAALGKELKKERGRRSFYKVLEGFKSCILFEIHLSVFRIKFVETETGRRVRYQHNKMVTAWAFLLRFRQSESTALC